MKLHFQFTFLSFNLNFNLNFMSAIAFPWLMFSLSTFERLTLRNKMCAVSYYHFTFYDELIFESSDNTAESAILHCQIDSDNVNTLHHLPIDISRTMICSDWLCEICMVLQIICADFGFCEKPLHVIVLCAKGPCAPIDLQWLFNPSIIFYLFMIMWLLFCLVNWEMRTTGGFTQ